MKKALFFIYADTVGGGAEEVMHMITTYLLNNGWEIHCLFFRESICGDWDLNNDNLKVYFGNKGIYGIYHLIKNVLKIKGIKFDLAFTSMSDFTALIGMLRRCHILKIAYFVGRESTSIFQRFSGLKLFRKKMMYYLGYPSVDTIISQTQYMQDQLLEAVPYPIRNAIKIVIPNPVNFEKIQLISNEIVDTKSLGKYIVSAGRLIPEKGFDVLITAYNKIQEEFADLKLVILGEGLMKEQLESLIAKYSLGGKVLLAGYVKNVYPYFRNAEACVVSSIIEGFPNVLLQMMSQNNRVISTVCAGGIKEIKGLTCCDPKDSKQLYIAIKDALKQNCESNRYLFDEELSKRSIKNFVEKFMAHKRNFIE